MRMSDRSKLLLSMIFIGVFMWSVVRLAKPSHLGGCISLGLIMNQVNKSSIGSYCWSDDTGYYCLIRKD